MKFFTNFDETEYKSNTHFYSRICLPSILDYSAQSSMIEVYGNSGNVHTFLIDFELAAMKAIGQVFPETRAAHLANHDVRHARSITRHIKELSYITFSFLPVTSYPV